jgi:hypothetical protein
MTRTERVRCAGLGHLALEITAACGYLSASSAAHASAAAEIAASRTGRLLDVPGFIAGESRRICSMTRDALFFVVGMLQVVAPSRPRAKTRLSPFLRFVAGKHLGEAAYLGAQV